MARSVPGRTGAGPRRADLHRRDAGFHSLTLRSRLLAGFALLVVGLAGCGSGSSSSGDAAASVNGHAISMTAYNVEFRYMRRNTAESTQFDVCAQPSYASLCRKLKQTALNTLIGEEIVRQYAAAHHITVSPQELERQWTVVLKGKFHANNQVLHAYLDTRQISLSDLQGIIRRNTLQNKVLYDVTKNMPRYVPAVELSRVLAADDAELSRVQTLLNQGTPFNVVVAQLSIKRTSLCAQQGCGELGWVPDALLPAEERAAATARPGTIVGPIAGQNGYSLLRVEGHLSRYPPTAEQDFAMRQRLFTAWLGQQERQATVRRYATA